MVAWRADHAIVEKVAARIDVQSVGVGQRTVHGKHRRSRHVAAAAEDGRAIQIAADNRVAHDIGLRRHIPGRDQVETGQDVLGGFRSRRPSGSGARQHNRRQCAQGAHGFRHFVLLQAALAGGDIEMKCCSAASSVFANFILEIFS